MAPVIPCLSCFLGCSLGLLLTCYFFAAVPIISVVNDAVVALLPCSCLVLASITHDVVWNAYWFQTSGVSDSNLFITGPLVLCCASFVLTPTLALLFALPFPSPSSKPPAVLYVSVPPHRVLLTSETFSTAWASMTARSWHFQAHTPWVSVMQTAAATRGRGPSTFTYHFLAPAQVEVACLCLHACMFCARLYVCVRV